MILDSTKLPANLSLNAVKVLAALHDYDGNDDGINGSDVAAYTGMHKVSAGEHLYKLETAGLVLRFPHPQDRRQHLFRLSRAGRDLVTAWQPRTIPAVHHQTPVGI